MKKIAILGSTGSIGTQTLEVIAQFPERFEVTALAAGSRLDLLLEQARRFKPKYVAIGDESLYQQAKSGLAGQGIHVRSGIEGLTELATLPEVDQVLTAVVGSIGIKPTLAAILAGKQIALANKETLVAAGAVIMPAAAQKGVTITPVDSEHSAIFQCLEGRPKEQLKRIILTASGGPFRQLQPSDLAAVTLEEALTHPNWKMGGKITIDSATMFNKGLEVIEAHWLFDVAFDQIAVLIHPESIVHSLIELVDGSVLAQLGLCDMRLPIQLALTYPERLPNDFPKLDLLTGADLHFEPVDPELFPAVALAYQAGRDGGSLPTAFNAANEEAVRGFQTGKLRFVDISGIVSAVMGYHQSEGFAKEPVLDEILAVDLWARRVANKLIMKGR